MVISGRHIIGSDLCFSGDKSFNAINPATGAPLAPPFHEGTAADVDRAACLAERDFDLYRSIDPDQRGAFLEAIAEEIEALGDTLVRRACDETGLPQARIEAERGRTCNQLRMFARLVREGSWVEPRIDRAQPERSPLPRPDVRMLHIPLGPVAVFGAGNFPLAFSVAGGDTASALAAGCPVVVKGTRGTRALRSWPGGPSQRRCIAAPCRRAPFPWSRAASMKQVRRWSVIR